MSAEVWTVHLDGATAKLIYTRTTPTGRNASRFAEQLLEGEGVTSKPEESFTGVSEVVIHRGAPAWESHPELRRGIVSVMTPGLFKDLIRSWTWEIPAKYLERSNEGELREFMIVRGGSLNWTLVLKFPRFTPDFVFERVALGFGATPYATPEPKPAPAPPAAKPKTPKAKALNLRRRR